MEESNMELFNFINKELCAANLVVQSKNEVLRELAKLIAGAGTITGVTAEQIEAGLYQREQLGTTGFGGGIAIPHCKLTGASDFAIAIAVVKKGVDFAAFDHKKVKLFIAIVGPEAQADTHVRLLAQISRLFKDEKIQRELIGSGTDLALYENFSRHLRVGHHASAPVGERRRLVLLILRNPNLCDDIFELLLEREIRGATVIEAHGLRNVLSKVPLFMDFVNFLGEHKNYSQVILMTVVASELDDLVTGVEEITGDLNTHTGAMLIALDMLYYKGTMESL